MFKENVRTLLNVVVIKGVSEVRSDEQYQHGQVKWRVGSELQSRKSWCQNNFKKIEIRKFISCGWGIN